MKNKFFFFVNHLNQGVTCGCLVRCLLVKGKVGIEERERERERERENEPNQMAICQWQCYVSIYSVSFHIPWTSKAQEKWSERERERKREREREREKNVKLTSLGTGRYEKCLRNQMAWHWAVYVYRVTSCFLNSEVEKTLCSLFTCMHSSVSQPLLDAGKVGNLLLSRCGIATVTSCFSTPPFACCSGGSWGLLSLLLLLSLTHTAIE